MKLNEVLNKDLILRENLAIERTDMAIDRTLLAFVRTSLYFAIAGMTLNSLIIFPEKLIMRMNLTMHIGSLQN